MLKSDCFNILWKIFINHKMRWMDHFWTQDPTLFNFYLNLFFSFFLKLCLMAGIKKWVKLILLIFEEKIKLCLKWSKQVRLKNWKSNVTLYMSHLYITLHDEMKYWENWISFSALLGILKDFQRCYIPVREFHQSPGGYLLNRYSRHPIWFTYSNVLLKLGPSSNLTGKFNLCKR